MVNAFLKPWPIKGPDFINRHRVMTRINAVFPGRLLGVGNPEPGSSLAFCRAFSPVPELAKLNRAPHVGRGWAAFVAATEDAGQGVLSEACRSVVGDVIATWDGTDPQMGTQWRDDVVAILPPRDRPGAAFALTCALASYRVDQPLIDAVRAVHPSDAALVSIAAWASGHAVRRIAAWL
jgi:hypothetical protein